MSSNLSLSLSLSLTLEAKQSKKERDLSGGIRQERAPLSGGVRRRMDLTLVFVLPEEATGTLDALV